MRRRRQPKPQPSSSRPPDAPAGTAATHLPNGGVAQGHAGTAPQDSASVAGLKDQLALLGLVVVLVGLISTETYYSGFGLRYQDLDLAATHLVYRGLTTLVTAWELAALYLVAMVWLATSDTLASRIGRLRTTSMGYALVIGLVICAYPLARRAGLSEARRDMVRETSTLETVECLAFERGTCAPEYRRFKHLITVADEILVFKPVDRGQTTSYPVLVHLPQGDVHELRTSPAR